LSQPQVTAPRLEPGSFFQTSDERTWRLMSVNGARWTIAPLDDPAFLGDVRVIQKPLRCKVLPTHLIHERLLAQLHAYCLWTEEGSRPSRTWENEWSGAWGIHPRVIVKKKRFRKSFIPPPDLVSILQRVLGDSFVATFFIQLETLGGYYPALTIVFANQSEAFYSLPIISRSKAPISPRKKRRKIWGTVPNLDRYQDQSNPKAALPCLRQIKDAAVLLRIANKAKLPAVRVAAKQILGELTRRKKSRR
jgi:hypothetical protein